MPKKILYKEVNDETNQILTPDEQANPAIMIKCVSTKLIEATPQEIDEAKTYYKKHKKCKNHLVYDEDTFMYYSRYCGICGKFIALI